MSLRAFGSAVLGALKSPRAVVRRVPPEAAAAAAAVRALTPRARSFLVDRVFIVYSSGARGGEARRLLRSAARMYGTQAGHRRRCADEARAALSLIAPRGGRAALLAATALSTRALLRSKVSGKTCWETEHKHDATSDDALEALLAHPE
jgi:hypothetical protein